LWTAYEYKEVDMKGYKPPPKRIRRPNKPTPAPPKLEGKMSDSQIYEAMERERKRRGLKIIRSMEVIWE